MSTPRERLRQPIDGPGRGHGAGWGRSQTQQYEYRRRFTVAPTYAEVAGSPPPPPTQRYTPAAATGFPRKTTRHVATNNQATSKSQEVNNNLRYDGSRYNQNAPPAEDENTDYQGCLDDPDKFLAIKLSTYTYTHAAIRRSLVERLCIETKMMLRMSRVGSSYFPGRTGDASSICRDFRRAAFQRKRKHVSGSHCGLRGDLHRTCLHHGRSSR